MKEKFGGGYHSRFVTIDKVTGQEVDGVPVYVPGRVRWDVHVTKGWGVFFQDAFKTLAKDKDLTGELLRIWLHLMGTLGFENFVIVNCTQIAKELNIKQPNVSRAMKKMVQKGLLLQGPRNGRFSSYRLSLDIGWKGSAKAYNENIRARQKTSAEELAKERWKIYEQEHLPKE